MQPEEDVKFDQMRDILEHFKYAKTVDSKILEEYCRRKKFKIISEGQYQDYLYQHEHDVMVEKSMPQILAILVKYKYEPTIITPTKLKEIREHNEKLEIDIANILEEAGIRYVEVSTVCNNLALAFKSMFEASGRLINNMAATVLSDLGKQKFGDDMPIKKMAEYHREEVAKMEKGERKS
jgi:hypothetical protein